VVDPYVKCFVEGPGFPPAGGGKVFETQVVDDNGFHPVWATPKPGKPVEASFTVPIPEMSTVVIQVYDHDTVMSDTILAERFAPCHLIRKGVRCVKLRDTSNEPVTNAFVLVSVVVARTDDQVQEGL